MYLHENSVYLKLFDDPEFVDLQNVVDNTMKEQHSMGLGLCEHAEVIALANEACLFREGCLVKLLQLSSLILLYI